MNQHVLPPRQAWVRQVPNSYHRCIRPNPTATNIDVAKAQQQHAGYIAALREAGVDVRVIAADHSAPDCCFVEDTAIVWRDRAVLTTMKPLARRREKEGVAAALRATDGLKLAELSAGTLDGGDVLQAGQTVFVGRSTRTNDAGIAALQHHTEAKGLRLCPIEVARGLHLKSNASLLDQATILIHGTAVNGDAMRRAGFEVVPVPEAAGANVIPLGDAVLVASEAPRTAAQIAARGYRVISLDISEFSKGNGALSCLSLRRPQ